MMKKLFEKRQWMMLTLVAVLGVAVYLNYYFTQEPTLSAGVPVEGESISTPSDDTLGDATFVGAEPESTEPTEDTTSAPQDSSGTKGYFDQARASRTAAREEAVRLISETLGAAQATAEQKAAAQQQTTAIAEHILQESNIEDLILAKGFSDCVVFLEGEHCQVVVQSANLQPKESVQILEIVLAQSGVEAKNVQITAPQAKTAN